MPLELWNKTHIDFTGKITYENGKQFTSHQFDKFTNWCGIKYNALIPYHSKPRVKSNAKFEQLKKTVIILPECNTYINVELQLSTGIATRLVNLLCYPISSNLLSTTSQLNGQFKVQYIANLDKAGELHIIIQLK
ncbi:hypothetical protein RF11_02115 [Thelohanellus kitauei]|uniref:Uncharacterized protein n=1 Tax=Thelohanellus kitauei TaxID=669202 RepID=A0A0C2ISJ9_THEKT|nr:hypothetical protein RF11_02115 [Thelohanellus kitauei]